MTQPVPPSLTASTDPGPVVPPVLIRVRVARRVYLESRTKFLQSLQEARQAGMSYRRIGVSAGITGQGVSQLLKRGKDEA